jgi:CRP-like cAMP-binding protein
MDPAEVLLRYPLFALLGRDRLNQLVAQAETVTLRTGQTLWDQDERGRAICVLLHGKVRVTRRDSNGEERPLGVLEQGSVFGDYALLPPHQAVATCRAASAGKALLIPLEAIRARLLAIRGVHSHLKCWLRLHALVHHLRHSVGFGFLTAPSVVPLLVRCQEYRFTPAHTLQADGLLSNGWMFVVSGEVAVHSDDQSPPRLLGPGDCFGEQALVGATHLATAVSMTPATCLYLPRDQFLEPLGGDNPDHEQTIRSILNVKKPRRTWVWFPQHAARDCGVAALAMALRGQGLNITLDQVAAVVSPGPIGTNFATLTQAAQRFGMQAAAVRIGLDQIGHATLPAVAHLSHGHYAALFELNHSSVTLGDPLDGIRDVSLETFRQLWSGSLLLLTHA